MNLYLVENRATRKRYVAATTVNMSAYRHRLHTDSRRANAPPGSLLADIAEHGMGVIRIVLVEVCDDGKWQARRQFFVNYFDTVRPKGYNWREEDENT